MSEKKPQVSVATIVSGVFLAVVVIGGLITILWPQDETPAEDGSTATEGGEKGPEEDADPVPSSPPSADPSFTASASGSLCGLEPHETGFEYLMDQHTEWVDVNGMRAPSSAEDGPGVEDGAVRYCYSRTADGAVLAAANFLVLVNMYPDQMDSNWERLIAPGPGRDDFISGLEEEPETDAAPAQIIGAKIVSYTEDSARVSIAITSTDGMNVSMSFDLDWVEGDWKIAVNADGTADPNMTVLNQLTGFTPWAAI